ncbi:MAG: carboxypeptidase-like regulatory domain-containing protein [Candidatus Thermoplasmatota archaeon]
MARWLALVALSLVVAGCSGDPSTSSQPPEEDIDYGVEATATTGVIRGLVIDEAIRPLAGVNVTIAALERLATTGNDGEFGFDGLEPGTYFLSASKKGFAPIQTSAEVVAGDSTPPITKISLVAVPTEQPYVESHALAGYLSFGAAIFATSIGTTINDDLADTMGDRSIWTLTFTQLPMWAQGELVWDQTQPAGGEFIWEMTDTSNTHYGYRETTTSPALAYWNTTVLIDHNETTLDPDDGIAYRFFGGPHPLCKDPFGATFGCGVTVQQKADAYIHNFFNFAPPEGWRFTVDGAPVVPPA